jgi:hypothetical protein
MSKAKAQRRMCLAHVQVFNPRIADDLNRRQSGHPIREDRSMAVINLFAPKRSSTLTPLEAGAEYFWRMARGLHDARRAGNEALASECAEAIELVSGADDHAAIRTAARRSREPLPSGTPSVVLKFPAAPAPRRGRRHEPQPKRKARRRA